MSNSLDSRTLDARSLRCPLNFQKRTPSDVASHPRPTETWTAPLRKPDISQVSPLFDIGCRNTEWVLQGNHPYTRKIQSEVTVHYYYSSSILRTRNGTDESRSQLTVNCKNTELLPNSTNENTAPKRFSSRFNLQPNRHDCLDADLASDVHCIHQHVRKDGFISD